jgi:hypothetical protein
MQEVLDNMPKDLYSTYSRIIFDLQRSDDWLVIDRILAFVSDSARQPLLPRWPNLLF